MEVDPRVTSMEHLDVLARHGFNRISLGVQDFTPRVQAAIERVQTVEQTRAVIDRARALGFRGVNVDLIYGLPHQETASFEKTIELVLDLQVDRAAVYSFAFVPWIRGHQKTLRQDELPSADIKCALFAVARERFLGAGYEPIGMDHFALPDDELAHARREGRLRRNFQGYTTVAGDAVVGLGVSAISDLPGGYFQNEKKLPTYTRAIEAGRLPVMRGVLCDADDTLRRSIIHELMCNAAVDIREVEQRFGILFADVFQEDLRRLRACEDEGLVRISEERIQATPVGEMFIRNVAMCFDRYWRDRHEDGSKPVFSRTV